MTTIGQSGRFLGFSPLAGETGHSAAESNIERAGRLSPLLALTVASIFLGVEFETSFAKLRPFDLLALVLLGLFVWRLKGVALRGAPYILIGALFTYLIFANAIVLSGLSVAVRESVQMAYLVILFGGGAYILQSANAIQTFVRILAISLFAIALFNAGYHLNQGIVTSWKLLDEPKLTHGYGVLLFGTLLMTSRRYRRPVYYLALIVMAALLVFSLERKGWGAAAVGLVGASLLADTGGMRIRHTFRLAILFVVLAVVVMLVMQIDGARIVLLDRFASIADFVRYGAGSTDVQNLARLETTVSNRARLVGIETGLNLFESAPVFGVGVSNYAATINSMPLPDYMKKGAHNEYLRVAAEMGLVGLIVYLGLYVAVLWRCIRAMKWMPRLSVPDRLRVRLALGSLTYAASINLFLGGGGVNMVLLFTPAMLIFSLRPPGLTATASADPGSFA